MFIYVIGYWTCEESEYTYLVSDDKYTKEEIEEMVHDCALKTIKEMKEKDSYLHSYQDIHGGIIQHLKDDYDFWDIEAEQEWTVFGWGSIFRHGDWNTYRDEPDKLTTLIDKILEAGYGEDDDSFLQHEKRWRQKDDN